MSLEENSLIKRVALIAGGTAAGQALVLAVSPLLTRLYSPEDFGVLAIYAALLSCLIIIGSLKYELAILLPDDDRVAASLVGVSAIILCCVCGLLAVILIPAANQVAGILRVPAVAPYFWLLIPGLLGGGLYQVLNYWALRQKQFKRIAHTKLSQGFGTAGTQLALGFISGPLGLIIGDIVGRMSGTATLAVSAKSKEGYVLKQLNYLEMRGAAVRYRHFALYSGISGLVNTLGLQLPALLLTGMWGPGSAGFYALTQRILGAPMALIGRAIVQVFFAEAATLARSHDGSLTRLFDRTARKLALFGALPLSCTALAGPFFFQLLFGNSWRIAGDYAQALALMLGMQLVTVPLSQTLNVMERQDLQLLWDLGRLAVVGGIFFAAHHFRWEDITAVRAYGIGMTGCYLILLFLSRHVLMSLSK